MSRHAIFESDGSGISVEELTQLITRGGAVELEDAAGLALEIDDDGNAELFVAEFIEANEKTYRASRREARDALNREMLGFCHAKRKGVTASLPSNFGRLIHEAERGGVSSSVTRAARKALASGASAPPSPERGGLPSPPTARAKPVTLKTRSFGGTTLLLPVDPTKDDAMEVMSALTGIDGIAPHGLTLIWCGFPLRDLPCFGEDVVEAIRSTWGGCQYLLPDESLTPQAPPRMKKPACAVKGLDLVAHGIGGSAPAGSAPTSTGHIVDLHGAPLSVAALQNIITRDGAVELEDAAGLALEFDDDGNAELFVAEFIEANEKTYRASRREARDALNREMLGFYHAKRKSLSEISLPSNFRRLIRDAEMAGVSSSIVGAARKALEEQAQGAGEEEIKEKARGSIKTKTLAASNTVVLPIDPCKEDSANEVLNSFRSMNFTAQSVRLIWCGFPLRDLPRFGEGVLNDIRNTWGGARYILPEMPDQIKTLGPVGVEQTASGDATKLAAKEDHDVAPRAVEQVSKPPSSRRSFREAKAPGPQDLEVEA